MDIKMEEAPRNQTQLCSKLPNSAFQTTLGNDTTGQGSSVDLPHVDSVGINLIDQGSEGPAPYGYGFQGSGPPS